MSAEIRILEPSDANDFEAFVRDRLASSMFLLSNARRAGLVDRGERYGADAGACDSGELVGVAAHSRNGLVLVQAPTHREQVVQAAVDALGRDVEGTLHLADQTARVVSLLDLPNGDDERMQRDSHEGLYRLRLDALMRCTVARAIRAHVGRRARGAARTRRRRRRRRLVAHVPRRDARHE